MQAGFSNLGRQEAVVVFPKKGSPVGTMLGFVAGMAVFAWIAYRNGLPLKARALQDYKPGAMPGFEIQFLCIASLVVFIFLYSGVKGLVNGKRKHPALTIDHAGVRNYTAGHDGALIEWADIQSVQFSHSDYYDIWVNRETPDAGIREGDSELRAAGKVLADMFTKPPIRIHTRNLTYGREELLALLNDRLAAYRTQKARI